MKKLVLMIVVTILALGTTGYAYAQTPSSGVGNSDAPTPSLTGAQGELGLMGSTFGAASTGMASGTADGLLHDYIVQAFADATLLTVEEIEARLADGETLKDIAISLDMTLDEFRVLIIEVRTAALDAALAAGVITQEQYDWMLDHLSQIWQGEATGKNWGAGGQMGKGEMKSSQKSTANGSASCTMTMSGSVVRGTFLGTCTQTP